MIRWILISNKIVIIWIIHQIKLTPLTLILMIKRSVSLKIRLNLQRRPLKLTVKQSVIQMLKQTRMVKLPEPIQAKLLFWKMVLMQTQQNLTNPTQSHNLRPLLRPINRMLTHLHKRLLCLKRQLELILTMKLPMQKQELVKTLLPLAQTTMR